MENSQPRTEGPPVLAEVWPVAADSEGIWLCSGANALYGAVPSYGRRAGDEAKSLALSIAGRPSLVFLHGTSWRQEDDFTIIMTFVAVFGIEAGAAARECWPDAMPISPDLLTVVGNPAPRDPITAPTIRYVDTLYHSLRHVAFLLNTDAALKTLTGYWRQYLTEMAPALAGMYQDTVPA